jgi:hypothetical protein
MGFWRGVFKFESEPKFRKRLAEKGLRNRSRDAASRGLSGRDLRRPRSLDEVTNDYFRADHGSGSNDFFRGPRIEFIGHQTVFGFLDDIE